MYTKVKQAGVWPPFEVLERAAKEVREGKKLI
jgi:hypothetical protein